MAKKSHQLAPHFCRPVFCDHLYLTDTVHIHAYELPLSLLVMEKILQLTAQPRSCL